MHPSLLAQARHPGMECPITSARTIGDKKLGQSLATLAAKTPGLFTKELEVHLSGGAVDLVVHSLKDVPTTLPDDLVLAAITERESPLDCLVLAPRHAQLQAVPGPDGAPSLLHALPSGAVLGTSSVRRAALLQHLCPTACIEDVRGNLNTRMAKLDTPADGAPQYDALVLASAGMQRLGWDARMSQELPSTWFGYSVGQGALGIEIRRPSPGAQATLLARMKRVQHPPTAARCAAERALLKALEGGCQIALAVTSAVTAGEDGAPPVLSLSARVLSGDGSRSMAAEAEAPLALPQSHQDLPEVPTMGKVFTGLATVVGVDESYIEGAVAVGEAVAASLLKQGVAELMPHLGEARPATYGSAEQAGVPGRS